VLRGCLLVLPSVGIGNVSQLSIDLILANRPNNLIGYIHSPYVLPFIGADATAVAPAGMAGTINTAIEVYECEGAVMIQQRTAVTTGAHRQFANELCDFITAFGISRVLVVSSAPAYRRTPEQVDSGHTAIVYQTRDAEDMTDSISRIRRWATADVDDIPRLQATAPADDTEDELIRSDVTAAVSEDTYLPLTASGVARYVFAPLQRRHVAAVVVSTFVSEGDNAADALAFAGDILTLIDGLRGVGESNKPTALRAPMSWRLMYGT